MKLDRLRTLEGQLLAISCLFIACIPISAAVILLRPKFEAAMSESYSVASASVREELKELTRALEDPASDPKNVCQLVEHLTPQDKEWLYQDWVVHHEPERIITVERLVQADPEYFLHRAEQTVVCGSSDQQKLGLRFLELSEHPSVAGRLKHLLRWTNQRHLPVAPENIQATLEHWIAGHPSSVGETSGASNH